MQVSVGATRRTPAAKDTGVGIVPKLLLPLPQAMPTDDPVRIFAVPGLDSHKADGEVVQAFKSIGEPSERVKVRPDLLWRMMTSWSG